MPIPPTRWGMVRLSWKKKLLIFLPRKAGRSNKAAPTAKTLEMTVLVKAIWKVRIKDWMNSLSLKTSL